MEQTRQSKRWGWGKRLLVLAGVGLGVALLVLGLCYHLAQQTPEWYGRVGKQTTEEQAGKGFAKLNAVQTWLGQRYAWDYATAKGNRPLVKEPPAETTISATEGEINSFMGKWFATLAQQPLEGGGRVGDLLQSPAVRMEPERITIAATIPSLDGRVMSLDLRPGLRDGKLELQLMGLRSGSLSLPEMAWGGARGMLVTALKKAEEDARPSAQLDRGGGANPAAASLVLARQGLDILEERPTTNVLMLPVFSSNVALPVTVQSVELEQGVITLTVKVMDAQEREGLLGQ